MQSASPASLGMTRRNLVRALAAGSPYASVIGRAFAEPTRSDGSPRFGFDDVVRRARDLAAAPFIEAPPHAPYGSEGLEYDSWRDIRFKPDRAIPLSASKAVRVEMFHLGFLYKRAIMVNLIQNGIVSPVLYSPTYFDYGRVKLSKPLPIDTGFAGFRLHYPLNDTHVFDEVISFLGTSYFRFLGRDQQYGLSARALCVEAGTEKESFPFFREFWLETPVSGDGHATIYALLDGEAATGAYRFDLTPGQQTTLDVETTLFPRRAGAKFGLAPLTSMFLTGENDHRVRDGFRAELHDSDGLLMLMGADEWIWRPLANPAFERTTSFLDKSVKGVGLMQRDRTFESYQDLELGYESRPSYFVEPKGDWGPGRVELIELSTPDETNDNIVAFWVPEKLPAVGEPIEFEYKLHWFIEGTGGKKPPAGYAVATRLGHSKTHEPELERFWVDFDGPVLHNHSADSAVEAVVSVTAGASLVHQSIQKNTYTGSWRVAFAIKPDGTGRPVELRCFIKREPHILTETWSYLWNP